jgi:signal transduction histidine kinase
VDRQGATDGDVEAYFSSAPIGMAQVDANGSVGPANAAFWRLLGVEDDLGETGRPDLVGPVVEMARRDILSGDTVSADAADAPLVHRTITMETPNGLRTLEVLGWSSGRGDWRVANLALTDEPQLTGLAALTEAAERARAARDIHDGLAQELWLAKLAAAGLEANPSLDADARSLCADLRHAIEKALAEARNAITAMRSLDVPSPPVGELLKRHVHEFSDRFGIRVECEVPDAPRVQPRVAIELLRVVQEALNNVRKHARPGRAVVRLEERRSHMVLSIRDDGVGFDPAIASGGYGRQSMHERAQAIGGRLTITSAPGRGTSVTLRVPLAHPEQGR